MQLHQQRVVNEKIELDDKIIKLAAFIKGDICKN
ncbi:crAss001_48 related protein [Providencia sp. PROV208]